jgi:hypothetical protein
MASCFKLLETTTMQLASVALELATQKDDVMPFYEASVTAIYIHYTTIVTVAI